MAAVAERLVAALAAAAQDDAARLGERLPVRVVDANRAAHLERLVLERYDRRGTFLRSLTGRRRLVARRRGRTRLPLPAEVRVVAERLVVAQPAAAQRQARL